MHQIKFLSWNYSPYPVLTLLRIQHFKGIKAHLALTLSTNSPKIQKCTVNVYLPSPFPQINQNSCFHEKFVISRIHTKSVYSNLQMSRQCGLVVYQVRAFLRVCSDWKWSVNQQWTQEEPCRAIAIKKADPLLFFRAPLTNRISFLTSKKGRCSA